MAELNVEGSYDTPYTAEAGGFGRDTQGTNHVIIGFTGSNTVANNDTFTLTGDVGIARAAWEPENSSDQVGFTMFSSQVLLFGAGGTHTGYLHLWLTG